MITTLQIFTVVGIYLSEYESFTYRVEAEDASGALSAARVLVGQQLGHEVHEFDDIQDFEDAVNDEVVFAAIFKGEPEEV